MRTTTRRCVLATALTLALAAPTAAVPASASTSSASSTPTEVRPHGPTLRIHGRPAASGRTTALRGRVHIIHGESGAPDRIAISSAGHTVSVTLPGVDAGDVHSGDLFDGTLALPAGISSTEVGRRTPARVVEGSITAAAAVTSPPHRRMLLAVMTNRGAVPADSTILSTAQSVADYWLDESDGNIASFTRSATVLHYATTHLAAANECGLNPGHADTNPLIDEARALYPGAGAYDTVVVVVPESCEVGGTVGLSTSGVTFNAGLADLKDVMAHEQGHELGLGHANRGSCSAICSGQEYEDYMSVMGLSMDDVSGLTSLNSVFRSTLGWTNAGEETVMSLTSSQSATSQDVTLAPREDASGRRSIRVVDPDHSGTYFVEYRRSQGRDVGSALDGPDWCCSDYDPGVSVLYRKNGDNASWMQSVGPGGTYAMGTDDGVWTSPSGGVKVDVLEDNGAGGAVVRVTLSSSLPNFAQAPNPTLPAHIGPGDDVWPTLGAWSPAYDTVDYEWRLDGVPVAIFDGAPDYWVNDSDRGKHLSVRVTMERAGYRPATRTSNSVVVAATSTSPTWFPGTLSSSVPRIQGKAKVRKMLRAVPGPWTAGTALHYQWFAGNAAIPGATASTIRLRKPQKKKRIRVRVIGTKSGYWSTVRYSAATKKVR